MTIAPKELKKDFLRELASIPGGEAAAYCFTCGACSGICPVSRASQSFDPRKIVHMVSLGLEEQLVAGEMIWECSQCESCVPVCPQEVAPAKVIAALREMARRRGLVTKERLFEWGKLAVVDSEHCVACLTCVRVCPFGAPRVVKDGYAVIDENLCRACGICVIECPAQTIKLKKAPEETVGHFQDA